MVKEGALVMIEFNKNNFTKPTHIWGKTLFCVFWCKNDILVMYEGCMRTPHFLEMSTEVCSGQMPSCLGSALEYITKRKRDR